MSMVLPNINYFKNAENQKDVVSINNGKWENGMAKKDVIGAASGSLIHIIANDIGVSISKLSAKSYLKRAKLLFCLNLAILLLVIS